MCVIVTCGAGTMPTVTQLAQMSDANPDGAGIAWHDGTTLHRYRNTDNRQTLAHILTHWEFYVQVPFLLHFRLDALGEASREPTHPFRFAKDGRAGFIARDGISRARAHDQFASNGRDAILAWQKGQRGLADGSYGQFALIDQNGALEWLTQDHQAIKGSRGHVDVSNQNWDLTGMIDLDLWSDQAWQDGYRQALTDHGLNDSGADPD